MQFYDVTANNTSNHFVDHQDEEADYSMGPKSQSKIFTINVKSNVKKNKYTLALDTTSALNSCNEKQFSDYNIGKLEQLEDRETQSPGTNFNIKTGKVLKNENPINSLAAVDN